MNQEDIFEKLGCSEDLLRCLKASEGCSDFEIPDYNSVFEVEPISVSHIDVDLSQIIVAGNFGLCEQGAAAYMSNLCE